MKNLEVKWIIEKNILDYTDRLIQHLKSNNISYKETNYEEVLYRSDNISKELLDENTSTIFVGSLRTAREINKYPLYPGVICNLKRYDCLSYYPSWGKYLLNNDYELVTTSILNRIEDKTITYFFRPNEGDKSFTGGVYSVEEILNMRLKDNQILIKSSLKIFSNEYRFLIVDREVIDGTQYKEINYTSEAYKEKNYYKQYLENILQDITLFIPDRAFTVDLTFDYNTNKIKVIELNSFSCANLYGMNMNKVVPAINQLAIDIYQQNNL